MGQARNGHYVGYGRFTYPDEDTLVGLFEKGKDLPIKNKHSISQYDPFTDKIAKKINFEKYKYDPEKER